ncbi:lamin tail domain-containing protein [Longimicrobium terrae]|uniref:LTD domain-containing protein n=1 Tax=Longimicrobium terrae TaxID=1639882 RepID=A0A841GZD7_9BACT|nr:lamin tail domain-containing protein [Longimicrobium terrae]MBB4636870.1 hypothetical protein [Longimicrobium terrae]MBB6071130.1 hypothetical protein [Longimicrobium terrae]NNC29179.1 lamin tail domain-containing protein [Longimicrobium terrae]
MSRINGMASRAARVLVPVLAAAAMAACGDEQKLTGVEGRTARPPAGALQAFDCQASRTDGVTCRPAGAGAGGASAVILGQGGNGSTVRVTSSNIVYDSVSEIFSFDVTVKNVLNEAIGTPDGVVPDPQGIQVFFNSGPTVTGGTGTASVANADGTGTFTAANQPFFAYYEILEKDEVSAPRTWRLNYPNTATNVSFTVLVETDVQYLLVINEVLTNPGGTIADTNGEWFEVYNAGTLAVNLQNLVIADSAAAGRRPYHVIASSVSVAPGGYAVLGISADTLINGGVKVDYAYGSALSLANSLDAIKIARVYGTDTLTVDRAAYLSAAISAQNGISRELINPALDNSNIDGANWADASVSAIYGPGGRGTPKAQNSAFVP